MEGRARLQIARACSIACPKMQAYLGIEGWRGQWVSARKVFGSDADGPWAERLVAVKTQHGRVLPKVQN